MIIFEKIRYRNFLSTGNNFTELDLNTHHTTILVGDSGSGKSTLLDAISFCLFNRAFRNINKAQMVNAVNNKDCLVEIEFTVGSTKYKVVRGQKPNIFEIYKNGTLINQDSASRDYQSLLEKNILKCNFKSFSQIVVLGAVNFVPFMQLKAADRRFIIEELLDLEIFSSMNNILKQKLSDIVSSISSKESDARLSKEKITLHRKFLVELESHQKSDTDKKKTEIASIQKQIEEKEAELSELKPKVLQAKEAISKFDVFEKKFQELSNKEAQQKMQLKKLESDISFYKKNDSCNTCKQSIEETFKSDVLQKLEDEQSKIKEFIANECSKGFKAIEAEFAKRDKLQTALSQIQTKIIEKQTAIKSLMSEKQKIENELSNVDTSDFTKRKNSALQEIQELETSITDIQKEVDELNHKKLYHEFGTSLLKDNGIKANIIKQYLPLINKGVNNFLVAMNFLVKFNLDETFEETIVTAGRDIFAYGNFSEGEKQRVDLALLFTWRTVAKMKNSIHTNLLIMDEIFDSYLDHDATESVIDVIKSEMFKNTNVIVISHKNSIVDKFDRSVQFTKHKNFSKVQN